MRRIAIVRIKFSQKRSGAKDRRLPALKPDTGTTGLISSKTETIAQGLKANLQTEALSKKSKC